MKSVLIIAITLFTVSLSGQAEPLSLESCAAIEHPLERLACYDTLAGRLPADTAKASEIETNVVDPVAPNSDDNVPTVPAVTSTVPAVEKMQDAEAIFGLEHKQGKDRPDKLKLKWTKKEKDGFGKWIITLENGQVWRQTDSRRFSFLNSEQWVVIYRGALGSFFMGEPESHIRTRVKRVK